MVKLHEMEILINHLSLTGEKEQKEETLPVRLAAELAQVDAADLAAALGASFTAQVASQRAVRRQGLQEYFVQRQVVGAQPFRSRRRDVHLGVTVGAKHRDGDGGSVLLHRFFASARRHRERLQPADTVGAEGVQTREDFRVPVQAFTRVTNRSRVHQEPAVFIFRA